MITKINAAKFQLHTVELEFFALCEKGRRVRGKGVTIQEFAENRKKYMEATEAVYHEMWVSIVDTGVKIERTANEPVRRN